MKKFLNAKQKVQMTYINMAINSMQELVDRNVFTPDEQKCFKMAITWAIKGVRKTVMRMGEELADKIRRDLHDFTITLVPKMKTSPDRHLIDDDIIMGLVEVLINDHCMDCSNADFINCAIFKYNQNLEIDSKFDEPEGVCPYDYMIDQLK